MNRIIQNPPVATSCGFESHHRHQNKKRRRKTSFLVLVAPLRGALVIRRAAARLPRLRSVAGVTPLFFRNSAPPERRILIQLVHPGKPLKTHAFPSAEKRVFSCAELLFLPEFSYGFSCVSQLYVAGSEPLMSILLIIAAPVPSLADTSRCA